MIDDKFLYSLIPAGEKNAISCSELSCLTGATTELIYQSVRRLRQSGYLICTRAFLGGFFRPETKDELAVWVRTRERCIKSYTATLRPAKNALKKGGGGTI